MQIIAKITENVYGSVPVRNSLYVDETKRIYKTYQMCHALDRDCKKLGEKCLCNSYLKSYIENENFKKSRRCNDEVKKLHDLMIKLKKSGYLIIYVSHFLDAILEVCDRVSILRDGNLIRSGEIKNEN